MESRIETAGLSFQVNMMDIRELDGEPLLESDNLDENIVSVLALQPDGRRAVRRILEKIGASDPEYRAKALRELMILAGLRNLGNFVEEESERMPILDDIMDHDFLGPLMRRSIATGRVEEGRAFFLKLAAKRFGPVPKWVNERIELLGNEELEDLGARLFDVKSLEELFGAR